MGNILPIVEGQSEVISMPILIRRILAQIECYSLGVVKPYRVKRNKVIREEQLENVVKIGLNDREDICAIMVILDADDDCPHELSPALLNRLKKVTDLPVSVIIAKNELECWFLGAKESLRGIRGIKTDAISPQNPEDINGKGGIKRNLIIGGYYNEVDDQPAFADRFDINQAALKCPSLNRFINKLHSLAAECAPATANNH